MTEDAHAEHRPPVDEDPSQVGQAAPTKLGQFYPLDDILAVVENRSTGRASGSGPEGRWRVRWRRRPAGRRLVRRSYALRQASVWRRPAARALAADRRKPPGPAVCGGSGPGPRHRHRPRRAPGRRRACPIGAGGTWRPGDATLRATRDSRPVIPRRANRSPGTPRSPVWCRSARPGGEGHPGTPTR